MYRGRRRKKELPLEDRLGHSIYQQRKNWRPSIPRPLSLFQLWTSLHRRSLLHLRMSELLRFKIHIGANLLPLFLVTLFLKFIHDLLTIHIVHGLIARNTGEKIHCIMHFGCSTFHFLYYTYNDVSMTLFCIVLLWSLEFGKTTDICLFPNRMPLQSVLSLKIIV